MKRLSMDFSKYLLYFALSFFAVGLTGCSNDDDVQTVTPEPDEATGTINADDQTLSNNTINVESVVVGQDSWLVARNMGSETDAEIVSDPVFLEEGTHTDVELPLTEDANITGAAEGDQIVIMLHEDTGTPGSFDYTGTAGTDDLITTSSGQNVSETITVMAPSLNAEDNQAVTENNEVTFTSVNTASNGWIVLYGQNEDGSINENDIIGRRYVEAGTQENFTVPFNEGYVHTPGSTVYPRLHMDDPADQEFSFTADGDEDLPETYGFDTTTGEGRFVGNNSETGGFTVQ